MNARLVFRMTAPVVGTSLLLLAGGVGAAWYVHRLQQSVSEDLRSNVPAMRSAEELEIVVRETRTQLDHFLITNDRKYLDAVPGFRPETERWLAQAERWSLTDREKNLTGRARAGYERFLEESDRMQAPSAAGSLPEKVRGLIDLLTLEILQPTHEYLDLNEQEVEDSVTENQVFATRLVWGLLLLGICGSGAGLVAGLGFARGFSRSLIQLSVPIRAAAGHLDAVVGPVTLPSGGDLPEMETVLRLTAERIGEVVERLRRSEREVLRSEQLAALGQMAAGMAHELRNPLTSMKFLLQAALAGDCPSVSPGDGPSEGLAVPSLAGRDLHVFEEEIDRLEQLIQSFLDFARPPHLEKKIVDIRPLVEQTVGLVAGRAARHGVRIGFGLPELPVEATVDSQHFRQVLLNLLLNALDAVAGGGAVCVEVENGPDGWLTLRVTDDGPGLPAGLGERIFAPFVTTKETGLGLGLSICKRIAEAHGGSISGEDRPGGGAVFALRLPPAAVAVVGRTEMMDSGAGAGEIR
jgi:signal transduction histidine kinase